MVILLLLWRAEGYHQSAVGHLSPFIHECRTYYLNSRFSFKQARIIKLIGDAEGVAIYGSGGLARLMYQIFRQNNITVLNFIEQSEKPPVHINGIDISVKALRDCLQQKIVVAAQPVRLEMVGQLTNLGLNEWRDFMVVA
ncbi:hypothetical protein [Aeromonas hydrophila]|uniref:hypothetical protein n=1 Tax=Aeromonas hydrophila TaxID=644 RepID=UPI001F463424|nr:hypothetical protein [Aeromonas hydrophila]